MVAPSIEGQVRAMRAAYDVSGLSPDDVDLIECHATGTLTGDAAELASMSQVFTNRQGLVIGSLKSNIGHAMTAAGAAGLMKLLGAIAHKTLPPARLTGALIPDLSRARFSLLEKPEKWVADGPRRAGINAFGFGGNNAHLIIEEWQGQPIAEAHANEARGDLVVVGVDLRRAAPVTEATPSEIAEKGRIPEVGIALKGLKFPPKDLQSALPQQAMMFTSARTAFPEGLHQDKVDIGVYIGMSADANISRYIARLRLPAGRGEAEKTGIVPPLDAARTIGVLGNVVANRINSQMDLSGPGIAIAAEEASGLVALKLAVRALSAGEISSAIIGAVDLSCDPVHRAALRAMGLERTAGDGVVSLVLTSRENAMASGCDILAAFKPHDVNRAFQAVPQDDKIHGVSHAAQGLMQIVMRIFDERPEKSATMAPPSLKTVSDAVFGLSPDMRGAANSGDDVFDRWNHEPDSDAPGFEVPMHWPEVRWNRCSSSVADTLTRQNEICDGDTTPTAPTSAETSKRPGPKFDRQDLLKLATGRISEFFGESFKAQDDVPKQTRMPGPPLLLVDRITGIDAPQGEIGAGSIWSETDVSGDGWYMHHGRMASGVLVETGQADLLLISWMGVDKFNEGQRVYRLLGCEITFHDALPKAGEILSHDIHIDRHVSAGSTRLFFFHSTCRVDGEKRLSITNGQAGFFTEEELNGSRGLFLPPTPPAPPKGHHVLPEVISAQTRFSDDQIEAFAAGHVSRCFGPAFEAADRHVNTPRLPSNALRFLQRVSAFDVKGGFWQRGYMKAERDITAESWFFRGHFHNDPCMPGTLILEGGLQLMMFYLAAIGQSLHRDGYRFQPAFEEKILVKCRGQVTPRNRQLTYECHVSSLTLEGDTPRLTGTLLCTVDGLLSFQAEHVSLCLTPAA
ncbi:beta-ketoacyl synthase N-terminal-like domain-containing protein [Sorlinia euscelidii]